MVHELKCLAGDFLFSTFQNSSSQPSPVIPNLSSQWPVGYSPETVDLRGRLILIRCK